MRICLLLLIFALAAPPGPAQPQRSWNPPQPVRTVLPNGLTVLHCFQPSSQMATLSAMVRAGSGADPEDLPGLANFTALMLSQGTPRMTAEQIASRIDFFGADLSIECDRDASFLTLTCLARQLDSLLPVFLDMLIAPLFDSSESEIGRHQILSAIKLGEDRPRQVSEEAFDALLYGSHPYGHPVKGFPQSVNKITSSDLKQFHRGHYLPNNTALAVVGPLPQSRIISRIKKLTAGWRPGQPRDNGAPQVFLPESPRAVFIHRPVSQAYITLGFFGPGRQDPDFQAARLMNYILGGGGFSSRLTKSIRVQHGLAYDVDAAFEPRLWSGPYRFSVQTKTVSADTAVKLFLWHLREMIEHPVSPDELQEAKDYLLGSYPFRFETGSQVARQHLMIEQNRLGFDYFAKDIAGTRTATAEELQSSARRLLKPGRFAMAVVGDTTQLRLEIPGLLLEKR
jgi:zinc protease